MALPILPIPPYPNVPPYPGVPLLARVSQAQSLFVRPVLLAADAVNLVRSFLPSTAADAVNLVRSFLPSTWGLYDESGAPLLIGDNVAAVDFKRDARMADYPIEKGGFSSYNKVQTPYDARATFTIGGSAAARSGFIAILDKLILGLTIVSLVTSDITYPSANVVHYDYRRTSKNGVTLLTIDVWIMEVRLTAGTAFTDAQTTDAASTPSPQAPSGASPTSAGTVQAAPLSAPQAAAVPASNVPLAPGVG